jgi:peptide/nickel transport system permease protein
MLILAFGATGLEWLPVIGLHDKDAEQLQGWDYAWDLVRHCILPVATLTYGGLAYLSRQMRVGMLETVRQDFIRTARAKGLSEKVVVFRHALRNSLIPVVTVFATILPILIGGSVIVETVFNIPGMGLYAFQGLITRDYNIVMATVTVSSIMTLLGFLLSDVLYAVVDPRISYD